MKVHMHFIESEKGSVLCIEELSTVVFLKGGEATKSCSMKCGISIGFQVEIYCNASSSASFNFLGDDLLVTFVLAQCVPQG